MNRNTSLFAFFLFVFFLPLIANAASPAGLWQTIDDTTGKPKGVVKITDNNGTLSGYVVSFIPDPGKTIDAVCVKCSGVNHNKRIKGMTILSGLKQDSRNPNLYTGGTILDPKTGKVYSSKLELSNSGRKVNVRGYIGFSMLGRTQTWYRIK